MTLTGRVTPGVVSRLDRPSRADGFSTLGEVSSQAAREEDERLHALRGDDGPANLHSGSGWSSLLGGRRAIRVRRRGRDSPFHLHELRQPDGDPVQGGGLSDDKLGPRRPRWPPGFRPAPEPAKRTGDGGALGRGRTDRPDRANRPSDAAPTPRNVLTGDDRSGRRSAGSDAEVVAPALLGDPGLTPEAFADLTNLVAAQHLMALLARGHRARARPEVIERAGALLLGLDDPARAHRIVAALPEVAPIVDIYPLEVVAHLVTVQPGYLPRVDFGSVILNKERLEARIFEVGEVAVLHVPLAARLTAFALEGGGAPGYAFAPGPPARYLLEVHDAGQFSWLIRADIRKESRLDRLALRYVESAGT